MWLFGIFYVFGLQIYRVGVRVWARVRVWLKVRVKFTVKT